MPKYEIELTESEIYRFEEIEADSEDEALEKAYDLISTDQGKMMHHVDSDGINTVEELD